MRRSDRLFQIIQIFRRNRSLLTARSLAEELEVSERTIYRDIADLQANRVPIEGAAGYGYILREGYDLPPLNFSEDELEALVLGARMVKSYADPQLALAAQTVLAKVEAVLPTDRKPALASVALAAPETACRPPSTFDESQLRRAIRGRTKVVLNYCDDKGAPSQRTIRPLVMAFFPPVWLVGGWCELRNDFRSFRLDRITSIEFSAIPFTEKPGKDISAFMAQASRTGAGS